MKHSPSYIHFNPQYRGVDDVTDWGLPSKITSMLPSRDQKLFRMFLLRYNSNCQVKLRFGAYIDNWLLNKIKKLRDLTCDVNMHILKNPR